MRSTWTSACRYSAFTSQGFAVEVGSGGNPHWRSNLLIDKYVEDSTERPGGCTPLVVDRPLVVGDACWLPLQDDSVDFIIARNLLEHIVDPETFFNEMMRVSRKGYITTPSILAEKLFGWSKHVWFVSVETGKLVLRPKEHALYDTGLSKVFHALYREDRTFRRFYTKNRDLFVVEYYWEGTIDYKIEAYPKNISQVKTTRAEFNLDELRTVLSKHQGSGGLRGNIAEALRRIMSQVNISKSIDIIDTLFLTENVQTEPVSIQMRAF